MATETVPNRPRMTAISANLLEELMVVATPHLSDEELADIADRNDDVRNMLGHIAETADGVAALIADDDSVGALRSPDEASKLLWLLAGHARHADSLLAVAARADQEIDRRQALAKAAP